MPPPRAGLLALAPHRSTTAALLAGAARRRSMEVTVLPVGGVPDHHRERGDAHDYGGPRFAARVARRLTASCGATLPSAVVVDVGRMAPARGAGAGSWAVVEADMAWFSDVYAADPGRALDVVLRAAGPAGPVRERDRAFWRAGPASPGE